MVLEVQQRQQDLNNRHHSVAEILRGDLQRINKDMAETYSSNLDADEESDGDMESDDEGDEEAGEIENEHDRPDEEFEQHEQEEIEAGNNRADLTQDNSAGGNERAVSKVNSELSRTRKDTSSGMDLSKPVPYGVRKKQAKILRLRADAMRLKQEAAKRLAEAYELEARILMEG